MTEKCSAVSVTEGSNLPWDLLVESGSARAASRAFRGCWEVPKRLDLGKQQCHLPGQCGCSPAESCKVNPQATEKPSVYPPGEASVKQRLCRHSSLQAKSRLCLPVWARRSTELQGSMALSLQSSSAPWPGPAVASLFTGTEEPFHRGADLDIPKPEHLGPVPGALWPPFPEAHAGEVSLL